MRVKGEGKWKEMIKQKFAKLEECRNWDLEDPDLDFIGYIKCFAKSFLVEALEEIKKEINIDSGQIIHINRIEDIINSKIREVKMLKGARHG